MSSLCTCQVVILARRSARSDHAINVNNVPDNSRKGSNFVLEKSGQPQSDLCMNPMYRHL